MNDLFFKLYCLPLGLKREVLFWYKNVWKVRLDDLYCCNGHMCGCMACTNRDTIQNYYGIYEKKDIDLEF